MLTYIKSLTAGRAVQIGGKASVGRGLCRMRIAEKGQG
jgi:CRISPR/Cas system CMR subunit Cmr4 (Cas7 group RAMP superfamily)